MYSNLIHFFRQRLICVNSFYKVSNNRNYHASQMFNNITCCTFVMPAMDCQGATFLLCFQSQYTYCKHRMYSCCRELLQCSVSLNNVSPLS